MEKVPYCVMVAQQILVLYVWVRVLVGQQKKRILNYSVSAFLYCLKSSIINLKKFSNFVICRIILFIRFPYINYFSII